MSTAAVSSSSKLSALLGIAGKLAAAGVLAVFSLAATAGHANYYSSAPDMLPLHDGPEITLMLDGIAPGAGNGWLSPAHVHARLDFLAGQDEKDIRLKDALRLRAAAKALPKVVRHGGARAAAVSHTQAGQAALPQVVLLEQDMQQRQTKYSPGAIASSTGHQDGGKVLVAPLPQAPLSAAQLHSHVTVMAQRHGVPVPLAHAVVQVESSGDPFALGAAGEIGLMQVMPATARHLGFDGDLADLFEPRTNLSYGMRYLGKAFKLAKGDLCGAILRYNAGHGARKMNPVSAQYCDKVKAILNPADATRLASR